jgi:DNA-binding NtrC family response regulator
MLILDDDVVVQKELGLMLAHLARHMGGMPLLYVAGQHDHEKERQARASGAHYYTSKPLEFDQFGRVLKSFLQVRQAAGGPAQKP